MSVQIQGKVTACRCRSYRLAPEAVFPDQYHDALAASRAFLSPEVLRRYGIDPKRVCVSGDSSGGNLAAAVAQEVNTETHTRTQPQTGALNPDCVHSSARMTA